ncbi:hypothetical protein FSST1_009800 [Fusarium sambucinum]
MMSLSVSDPFVQLPAELRLHIIMSTNCTITISRLIQASPSMLQQYLADKRYIQRHIIDYDEDMMQDVMAIILIPRFCRTSQEVPDEKNLMSARTVLHDWSMGQLPHPSQLKSDDVASQLNELHNRILLLAEDYITKATASFPPQDYLCLPQMQRPSANGHLMFRGVAVTPRFNLADLTTLEKKRVFKAFIRHELMARAISLFSCETQVPTRLISQRESDCILCVREYYRTLYGAMFAQCSFAKIPVTPGGTSLETELQFPDTFHFDGNTYAHELDLYDANWWETFPDFAHWFALLGLDRLTEFPRFDMGKEDDRDALCFQIQDTWFDGGTKHTGIPSWLLFEEPRLSRHTYVIAYPVPIKVPRHLPHDIKTLADDSNMYKQLSGSFDNMLQKDIARQRAWAFFDDTRLYPQETIERPNFPSSSFLKAKCIETNSHHSWYTYPPCARANRRTMLGDDARRKLAQLVQDDAPL